MPSNYTSHHRAMHQMTTVITSQISHSKCARVQIRRAIAAAALNTLVMYTTHQFFETSQSPSGIETLSSRELSNNYMLITDELYALLLPHLPHLVHALCALETSSQYVPVRIFPYSVCTRCVRECCVLARALVCARATLPRVAIPVIVIT